MVRKLPIFGLLCFLVLLAGCDLPASFPDTTALGALQVESTPKAEVFINHKSIGSTPLNNKRLKPGMYALTLKTDQATWTGQVTLTSSTVTVVSKDLQDQAAIAPGFIITLEKGNGIAIIGNPSDAAITIDQKPTGTIPYYVSDLTEGSHDLLVSAPGYVPFQKKVRITKGYQLVITIDLKPASGQANQLVIPTPSASVSPSGTPATSSTRQVQIKPTGTGWLRIRELPSLKSVELFKVNTGEIVDVVETQNGWMKIKTKEGKQGWGSSEFLQEL